MFWTGKIAVIKNLSIRHKNTGNTVSGGQKKKVAIMSMGGGHGMLSKVERPRFFVSNPIYKRRANNFIKTLKVKKLNPQLTIGLALRQKYIYEVELKDQGITFTNDDFILPTYRNASRGGDVFDQHKFRLINNTYLQNVQRILLPKQNDIIYWVYQEKKKPGNFLMTQAEKYIEKIHFNAHQLQNLY